MSKLKALPGATGGSPKARRSYDPDKHAARSAPHWFALRDSELHIQTVRRALRASPATLAAMAPLRCRVHWPQELGMCPGCLNEAAALGRPVTWPRHWMHPLATVCEIQRSWLTPVASASLARIQQARSLIELASLAGAASDDVACVDDALWLQCLCLPHRDISTPWGTTTPLQLCGVVTAMARGHACRRRSIKASTAGRAIETSGNSKTARSRSAGCSALPTTCPYVCDLVSGLPESSVICFDTRHTRVVGVRPGRRQ